MNPHFPTRGKQSKLEILKRKKKYDVSPWAVLKEPPCGPSPKQHVGPVFRSVDLPAEHSERGVDLGMG